MAHSTMQKIYQLDRFCPEFPERLYEALCEQEYVQCNRTIPGEEPRLLAYYLYEALGILDPSSDVFAKCLQEIKTICGVAEILPTSHKLPIASLEVPQVPIAIGEFADTYKATLGTSNVCVKRIRTYVEDRVTEATKVFCREVAIWKRLSHPNVLPFLGVTLSPLQLISGWVATGNLPVYMRANPDADRLGLLRDVATGLGYLHSQGIIHGAIKGLNIFVDVSENSVRALLGDVGASIVGKLLNSTILGTGGNACTEKCAAPEVLRGENPSFFSDIYSFAMVMIEVFTGQPPFNDKPCFLAAKSIILGERPPRPSHPDCSDDLWVLIQRCWDENPNPRPEISKVRSAIFTAWSAASKLSTDPKQGTEEREAIKAQNLRKEALKIDPSGAMNTTADLQVTVNPAHMHSPLPLSLQNHPNQLHQGTPNPIPPRSLSPSSPSHIRLHLNLGDVSSPTPTPSITNAPYGLSRGGGPSRLNVDASTFVPKKVLATIKRVDGKELDPGVDRGRDKPVSPIIENSTPFVDQSRQKGTSVEAGEKIMAGEREREEKARREDEGKKAVEEEEKGKEEEERRAEGEKRNKFKEEEEEKPDILLDVIDSEDVGEQPHYPMIRTISGQSRTSSAAVPSQMSRQASVSGFKPDTPGGFTVVEFPTPVSRIADIPFNPQGSMIGKSGQINPGSDHSSDEGNDSEPAPPYEFSANRWMKKPPADEGRNVEKKIEALLNKLTMEKFDSISDQIIALANTSEVENDDRILIHVISLVFEKATDEAAWSEMYARLCRKMMEAANPNAQDDGIRNTDGKPIAGGQLFRKYLSNRCQEGFERSWATKDAAETPGEAKLDSDEYYAAQKAKRRGLGLIQFMGELYKVEMLTEDVMHEGIGKLLRKARNHGEEEIEGLCRLLPTVGELLDSRNGRLNMEVHFTMIKKLGKSSNVAPHARFMLRDLFELRERMWVPRNQIVAPTTIADIHGEVILNTLPVEEETEIVDNSELHSEDEGGDDALQTSPGNPPSSFLWNITFGWWAG